MIRRSLKFARLLLVAPVIALVSACGGSDRLATVPVTGKVVDGKKPVANATVVLHPVGKDGEGVLKPRGKTDAEGNFKLTSYDGEDGAPAGEYRVTVELWTTLKPEEGPQNRLPKKYASADTSGLNATVGSAPTDLQPFEIKR